MADKIQATPRNPFLGLLSDAYGWMQSPQRTQQLQGFAGLLGTTGIPQTIERMAYGEPLTNIGRANVPLLKPETADALMNVAPFAGPAARGAGRLAGSAVNEAMVYGRGPLAAITPQPMRIVPTDVAKRIDMPVNLPTSKEFMKAVENEPSAQITEQGLLMNLKRMQTPEQSGMESVRTGVFYLPEGQAANLKHYKGKTGYGGAESIEGETLYKNPLFVKGATGGKAPEAAYDQLMGKGAYQNMRNEVLNSYGYNSNQGQKIESIQGLLEKYNGLDSDDAYNMAYNIVSNSKGGNTLPYAVQENIVANAVRNAGYDAVLGYGKGRGNKGEFFSEVFDVREATYPTPQGDFELMPQFQGLLDQQAKSAFTYPQEEAMRLAQQRAALPVEQGGLGLAANNTAEQRAAAMGFDTDLLHGTDQELKKFESKRSISKDHGWYGDEGVYLTPDPNTASGYANWKNVGAGVNGKLGQELYGQNVMPLVVNRGNVFDYGDAPPLMDREKAKEFSETIKRLGFNTIEVPNKYASPEYKNNYETVILNPDDIRSRFAAFDPFRRNAAIAAAMGVAAPNLLAQEQPQSAGLLYPLP